MEFTGRRLIGFAQSFERASNARFWGRILCRALCSAASVIRIGMDRQKAIDAVSVEFVWPTTQDIFDKLDGKCPAKGGRASPRGRRERPGIERCSALKVPSDAPDGVFGSDITPDE